jgi:hypothetical protein
MCGGGEENREIPDGRIREDFHRDPGMLNL